ncbi:DEAD/DEAH box helicase [Candidatus Saccharibacteria bacterium]|nr:MAG: DEAD/DEAH box helicase [Candidatus Saccharibacteria bacterium]
MSYSYRSTRSSARGSGRRPGGQQNRNRSRGGGGNRQYIDPSRFIKVANPVETQSYEPLNAFTDFALPQLLQDNLAKLGYKLPSPIQDQAIPVALTGKDVIGIASTGTGKTAAFGLPVLARLLADRKSAALIVAPTRELAQQIEAELRKIARGSGLTGAVLIGGTSMGPQLRDLRAKPRVVIGTPGRIKDHLERGTLNLQNFTMVVLDEVDRMLDMGFVNDVTDILSQFGGERQSFFFSATMDERVRKLITVFTENPVTIALKASSASENVHQDVVKFQSHNEKLDKLHDILIRDEVSKAIIFDETQRSVERLSNELVARGFQAESLHGGKSQGQRQRALAKFKKSEVRVLVATDVAARGIDIVDITHVVNYSVPKVYDDYIHRIGRAGRAGKVGYALTFVGK